MIKFLVPIYPDESVYSYLCRLYCHSGYVWHRGFANEVFSRWCEVPEYNFINVLNDDFRKTLEEYIPYKKLLLEHTLFPYYARFLPKERKIKAYEYAIKNEPFIHKYLPIPNGKNNYYLRYCPKCVEEDRQRYGECYFHIQHLIPSVHVCPFHNCDLVDTAIPNSKQRNCILMPLEQIITENGIGAAVEYEADNINLRVAKYINDLLHQPLNLDSDIFIGDYLTVKLKNNYVSPRGEQRYLVEINRDMAEYFNGLKSYDITKQRLAYVFRNNYFNPYDISLIAMFEDVTSEDLCACSGFTVPKHIMFDRQVRELRQQGKSYAAIADIMNVNHEVVRQILLGTYDKSKSNVQPYKCPKWDWATIDDKCCKQFNDYILLNCEVSRKAVAEHFGLKDKTLRNLPRLKKMILDYKKSAKLNEVSKRA
ncbi:MAG: TniQ family protein [Clostridia bacterium]|nr:TniQ family protein [Clostridia bacterium]